MAEPAPTVALHLAPPPPAGEAAPAGPPDRAAELIAAGAGRRKLARELDITEHEARALLDRHREVTG